MRESHAQIVLLVRAFEEADREGQVLPFHARSAATQRALRVTGLADWDGELIEAEHFQNGETVWRRARVLFDTLGRRGSQPISLLRVARFGLSTAPAVIGIASLVGLATNLLGPQHLISILAFPLLAIIGWNLLVYVGLAGARLWSFLRGRPPADRGGESRFQRLAVRLLRWAVRRRLLPKSSGTARARIRAKTAVHFGRMWLQVASPLLASRVRRMLHLAAMAMTLGAIVGMYLRGLAFEYRATWESTLLDASGVQTLLGIVLGPAAWVLSRTIPDVAPLRDLPGDAAIWIHLYAMTGLLFVVLPRGVLALIEGIRAWRLSQEIDIDLHEEYFQRIFTPWRGASTLARVIAYSFRPSTATVGRLKTLLFELFGARADIRLGESLDYGEELPSIGPDSGSTSKASAGQPGGDTGESRCTVLMFNAAQSPESEVQGALLDQLKQAVEPDRGQLLVILDLSTYAKRPGHRARAEERAQAWERVVREAGLSMVRLDPDRSDDQDWHTAARSALWPAREPVEGP